MLSILQAMPAGVYGYFVIFLYGFSVTLLLWYYGYSVVFVYSKLLFPLSRSCRLPEITINSYLAVPLVTVIPYYAEQGVTIIP